MILLLCLGLSGPPKEDLDEWPPARDLTLVVQCVDVDNQPLGNVELSATWKWGYYRNAVRKSAERGELHDGRADGDGKAKLPLKLPAGDRSFSLHARKRHFAPADVRFSRTTAEVKVKLFPAVGDLRGNVRDAAGRPVPGAELTLWNGDNFRTEIADAGGNFAFDTVSSGGKEGWTVQAEHPDFGKAKGNTTDLRQPLALVIEPPGVIAGSVVDEDGQPHAGAKIWAMGSNHSRGDAVVGKDGRYRIVIAKPDGEEFGLAVHANAEYAAKALRGIRLNRGQTVEAPVLKTTRGTVVYGQVVNAETGKPLDTSSEIATVNLDGPLMVIRAWIEQAPVGKDGWFRVRLPPGRTVASQYSPYRGEVAVEVPENGDDIKVELRVTRVKQ